jgi:hypothetical protein
MQWYLLEAKQSTFQMQKTGILGAGVMSAKKCTAESTTSVSECCFIGSFLASR